MRQLKDGKQEQQGQYDPAEASLCPMRQHSACKGNLHGDYSPVRGIKLRYRPGLSAV
jgi:hypothetical protein